MAINLKAAQEVATFARARRDEIAEALIARRGEDTGLLIYQYAEALWCGLVLCNTSTFPHPVRSSLYGTLARNTADLFLAKVEKKLGRASTEAEQDAWLKEIETVIDALEEGANSIISAGTK